MPSVDNWNPGRAAAFPDERHTASRAHHYSFQLYPRWEPHPAQYWNDPQAFVLVAQENGLHGKSESMGPRDVATMLSQWISRGETVIVHRVLDGHSPSEGHYCVVQGIDAHGVTLMDPGRHADQYHTVPWSLFRPQFHNALNPQGVCVRISNQPVV